MSKCTCAADWRAIPKDRRVVLEEPGAAYREGGKFVRDMSKVHVFDKNCPLHGYKEIVNG